MLVFNENYKDVLPKFKEAADSAKFVSFDCEMTGVTLESKTDGTKYDTQQFRYLKTREVVKTFDLIQIGFTFFIEKTKELKTESKDKKEEIIKENFYLERTFNFYLFKNSRLKFITKDLFDSELICHPASLKFLNINKFDLNILVSKGIHYNKLNYKEKIRTAIKEEGCLLANNSIFLSKDNEDRLITALEEICDFLLKNHEKEDKKRPSLRIDMKNKVTATYLLGLNLKKIFFMTNFTVSKNKEKLTEIIIEKTKKNLQTEEFKKKYDSFDGFKNEIKTNKNIIYQARHQLCIPNLDEETIEELIRDELGFSVYIEYLIEKKIPIVGHNIYFDMMFIYDKLIGDLPKNFYDFKTEIHKCFPIIYDTKAISMKLGKFDNTKLETLYKALEKNKYTTYVPFCADVVNGFCIYSDLEGDMLHDAGYDSIITGRCFILICKGIENDFKVSDLKAVSHGAGKDIKSQEKEVNVKKGFIDDSSISEYSNFSQMSIVDSPLAIVKWDTTKETKGEFEEKEKKLINETFGKVFHSCFVENNSGIPISIYEIADIFENEKYDISIVKTDYNSAFVELLYENYENEEESIKKTIEKIKENNKVLNVIPAPEFYEKKEYEKILFNNLIIN